MLKAKSIIKDKFYIVEDSNGKVGTAKVSGDAVDYYNTQLDTSVTMTLEEFTVQFDVENKDEMQKEQDRISNGFLLFGKYFENLWD